MLRFGFMVFPLYDDKSALMLTLNGVTYTLPKQHFTVSKSGVELQLAGSIPTFTVVEMCYGGCREGTGSPRSGVVVSCQRNEDTGMYLVSILFLDLSGTPNASKVISKGDQTP